MLLSSIPLFLGSLIIWLLTVVFDKNRVLLHYFTCFWGYLYIWIMPTWKLTVRGKEHFRKGETYVIVSNHQSQLDILVSFGLFKPFKWVSKIEVFRVPLIGWNMTLNNYVKLRRGNRESIVKMMQDCSSHLKNGSSIFLFPEGTRSPTGQVKAFKPGAFTLALKEKVGILPIVINGSKDVLPKHSLALKGSHQISVEVLPEIPYEEIKSYSAEELAKHVESIIAQQVITHSSAE
jgi:1-acyl-sn-glycerol-3-phosphate acyltransferase